jgi:hypothetical protein
VLKPFKRDDEDFMVLGGDKRGKGGAAAGGGGKAGKASARRAAAAVVHDYETLSAFSKLSIEAPKLVSDLDRTIAEVEAKRVRARAARCAGAPPDAGVERLVCARAGCMARGAPAGCRRCCCCRRRCRGCPAASAALVLWWGWSGWFALCLCSAPALQWNSPIFEGGPCARAQNNSLVMRFRSPRPSTSRAARACVSCVCACFL